MWYHTHKIKRGIKDILAVLRIWHKTLDNKGDKSTV